MTDRRKVEITRKQPPLPEKTPSPTSLGTAAGFGTRARGKEKVHLELDPGKHGAVGAGSWE